MNHESLKLILIKLVQIRNQIKFSSVSAMKQKRKQHHIEKQFKQTIVLQNSFIETLKIQISGVTLALTPTPTPKLKSQKNLISVRNARNFSRDRTMFEIILNTNIQFLFFLLIIFIAKNATNILSDRYIWLITFAHQILVVNMFFCVVKCQFWHVFFTAHSYRCESCQINLFSSFFFCRHMKSEKHRQILVRFTNQDLNLNSKKNASFRRDTIVV